MGNFKQIKIKNQTFYFFNDMMNIKGFDSNLQKIDKNSYKNINIYYIGYISIKSYYENISSVNLLYLIIGEVDGYIEKSSRNKYLISVSTDKNKEALTKYTKLWDKIKYLIKTPNCGKEGKYRRKDFMKVKFNSDDDLPLNKVLKLNSKC